MQHAHTYLLEPGEWLVQGTFFDKEKNETHLQGQTSIRHFSQRWEHVGSILLLRPVPVEIDTTYHITPFDKGTNETSWRTVNRPLGRLNGRYAMVNESILSVARSESGYHRSFEYLLRITDYTYQSRGALFVGDDMVSSWTMTLNRQ